MHTFSNLDTSELNELWASLALRHLPGLGPVKAKRLVDAFGSPYAAVESADSWGGLGLPLPQGLSKRFSLGVWRTEARADWESIKKCACGILLWTDPAYPAFLKEIPDAPLILFYIGDKSLLSNPSLGIVGARKCTPEGLAVTAHIARDLGAAGMTIVSGMAVGIDRVAHLCGLEGVGSSVAVLGCGVDVLYPAANADLYSLMSRRGVIVSEFVPGTQPRSSYFPIRNRIISGLSYGVLVVEAALRSGTLITARHATEQNRQVYAVPGSSLSATSQGCQELIRRGARVVFRADDVLEDIAHQLREHVQEKTRAFLRQKEAAFKETALGKGTDLACEEFKLLGEMPPSLLPWDVAKEKTAQHSSRERLPQKAGVEVSSPPLNHLRKADAPRIQQNDNTAVRAILPDESSALLVECLRNGAAQIDELGRKLGWDDNKLSSALAVLEVYGIVERKPGMLYALKV